ncbi:TRAP transporter substrate-binding protein [Fusobacterium necrophorum]|uniref:C4-dicarboxylate ABC transporter n=2 Tax=Fusobacterium necrophorum TaxID=859 RepID=A0AB73BV38_9FUSO|nr:TRAP transporter substrate-binding protein [Fusobacterium necrophorum]KDE62087.1 C4-dicarboxylate ABC transporter [Fusobacterium necrophorum BL]KDE64982.1 C4-dicarboxylate ABC transporter [Fusobacterium necrophorum DJ-1]KDE70616.1 C4-dicarboxylate ABC transporter [Fusobacterium necrophorum DAB]KDE72549.1 C4-dicarboxylate ABC transporter [Fusobacterium necrophorum DJ-2]KDE74193.1 C4-dicarboxylate ABC transporter [Fusobacterium necrophorum BFTR-2]
MGKKIVAVMISLLFLIGCSDKKAEENKIQTQVLKVAFNQSEKHPQFKALKEFGKKLEAETKGAYKLEISPNALLGDQRATVELVQNGVIQMAVVGNPVVENFNKDFAVIGLPYLYDNLEHQKKVFLSDILKPLFQSVSQNGFEVVGIFTAGARCVYTNKAITSPDDLKGYKIRVMQSDTMKKMLDFMGGIGTPMGQGEVYTAIQQGVLEGGENNEVTYVDLKHYEVAPYFSYTNHLMVPDLIIINEKLYNEMNKENRKIFDNLINNMIEDEFDVWNENVENAKKIALENGAKFIEVEIKPFQERVKPLQEEVIKMSDTTKNIFEEVRKLSN